ncbi:MAG TPA: hypothetical protein VGF55_31825, partial [Gemmataceae bacterium]
IRQRFTEVRKQLAELGRTANPLERERADLRDLAQAKLTTPDDTRRLEEVEQQLAKLAPDRARLEGQLQGKAPWFTAPDAKLPEPPAGAPVRSARVKVVTWPHDGADTRNYVYFRTGGTKFLLANPDRPLAPTAGVQEFDLDLDAGPLSAAARRGWALGTLAPPQPQGDAPDRWHPQRLVVELDGQVAYDSDRDDRDRRSLEAVRLIPPAQLDWDGKPLENKETPRERFVWFAGSGVGLGEDGKPAPVPESAKPEAGLAQKPDGDAKQPPVVVNINNFPGEGPPWPAPDVGPQGPAVIIVPNVYNPAIDPRSAGRPFQVENVRITEGVKADDWFTVRWDFYGDESAVDHYEVYLVELKPAESVPGHSPDGATFRMANLPPGSRLCRAKPDGLEGRPWDPTLWARPLVVAVSADPSSAPTHMRHGPARPVFPKAPLPPRAPLLPQPALYHLFWRGTAPTAFPGSPPAPLPAVAGPFAGGEAAFALEAAPPTAAAWQTGLVECNGVTYSDSLPASNIVVRPASGSGRASVWLRATVPPSPGKARLLVAHLGIPGAAAGQVDVKATVYKTSGPPGPFVFPIAGWHTVSAPRVDEVTVKIPATPGPYTLTARYDFQNFAGDPAQPPTLLGVRLVEEP